MNTCIFSRKTEMDGATFISREHVIPAFLGGIKKLPNGYVCDEINKWFSGTLETHLSRKSILSFIRHINGPGKRGAQDYQSPPFLAEISDIPTYAFVQINNGEAKVLPQIIINEVQHGKYQKTFFSNTTDSAIINREFEQLMNLILSLNEDSKFVFLESPFILPGQYYITYGDDKLYIVAFARPSNIEQIRTILYSDDFIDDLKDQKVNSLVKISDEIMIEGIFQQTLECEQALAKIDMNIMAFHKGQVYALRKNFDEIRNFILSKQALNGEECIYEVDYDIIRQTLKVHEQSHVHVLIFRNDGFLEAHASYYNTFAHDLVLTKGLDSSFEAYVFICDWKNRKEYDYPVFNMEEASFLNIIDKEPIKAETTIDNIINSSIIFYLKCSDPFIEKIAGLNITLSKPVYVIFDTEYNKMRNLRYAEYGVTQDAFLILVNMNCPEEYIFTLLIKGMIYFNVISKFLPYVEQIHKEYGKNSGEADMASYINQLVKEPEIIKAVNDLGFDTEFLFDSELWDLIDAVVNDNNQRLIDNEYIFKIKIVQFAIIWVTATEIYRKKIELLFKIKYEKIYNKALELIKILDDDLYHISTMSNKDIKLIYKKIIDFLDISSHIKVIDV